MPLHNACSYGHLEVAEILLEAGASVKRGGPVEVHAAPRGRRKGKFHIAKLLLTHGADPSRKNRDGHTPLGRRIGIVRISFFKRGC